MGLGGDEENRESRTSKGRVALCVFSEMGMEKRTWLETDNRYGSSERAQRSAGSRKQRVENGEDKKARRMGHTGQFERSRVNVQNDWAECRVERQAC